MKVKRINNNKIEQERCYNLYIKAFPREERMPFTLMQLFSKRNCADWWSFYDGDTHVGFIHIIKDGDVGYVFYYAIREGLRGKGYGSRILSFIKEKYSGTRLILAIEPIDESADNYEERVRRKKFYARNGFFSCGRRIKEAGVEYEMLGTHDTVTNEDFERVMKAFLGNVYGSIIVR